MTKDSSHRHNTEVFFQKLIEDAKKGADKQESKSDLKSDEDFVDFYDLEEAKKRSRSITSILQLYENSYKNKIDFQDTCRRFLFFECSLIIAIFLAAIGFILYYTTDNLVNIDISAAAALITALLSSFISIIKLLNIITKYCFPKNDEEYIIKIVESIQKHDFESVKEHNRLAEQLRMLSKNLSFSNLKGDKVVKAVPKKKK